MLVIRRGNRLLLNVTKRYFATSYDQNYDEKSVRTDIGNKPKKLLRIALLGLPNAGKSTLINQLVQRPICAASSKIHTTKVKAFAVYNKDDTQLIFIDTPGLTTKQQLKRLNLDSSFADDIKGAIREADIIGIMQDMQRPESHHSFSKRILNVVPLARKNTPFILILNKVDLLKKKTVLLDAVQKLTEYNNISFDDIFMISALNKTGVDDLRNYFLDLAKTNEWIFNEDEYTDQNVEEIIQRTVHAKLLDNVKDEIPYKAKTVVLHVDYDDAKNINAIVEIQVHKPHHRVLVMGSGGRRIRIIALQAEQELCTVFRAAVFLKVAVVYKDKARKID